MTAIAAIGSMLIVTPQDDIWIETSPQSFGYVRDFTSFRIRVDGFLEEHGTLFGVYGAVVGGPARYRDLTASLLLRLDGADWTRDRSSQANFKVGLTKVRRISNFDFRDPRGTETDGFPKIGRFGRVEVLNAEPNASPIAGFNSTPPASGS